MKNQRHILIIDDDKSLRKVLASYLMLEGFGVTEAGDGAQAMSLLAQQRPDLVLLDMKMPGASGLQVLGEISQRHTGLPVIMVSGFGDIPSAIEATRLGAVDFLQKPFEFEYLKYVIDKAFENITFKSQIDELSEWYENSLELIMGRSASMRKVIAEIKKVADTNMSIIISGETGTGKTYLANMIHNLSKRRNHSFITVDFGTIPESLIESEMFGFERGSFTGAEKTTAGYFEKAHGGTIFIDELQNISVSTQKKLLKVIEDKWFCTIGGSRRIDTDCRVICATNCDIQEAVKNGVIREDLFYRLSEYSIALPPLRERAEDIPLFVEKFLIDLGGELERRDLSIAPPAMDQLVAAQWKGNIRELKNVIRNAILNSETNRIAPETISHILSSRQVGAAKAPIGDKRVPITLKEAEAEAVTVALRHTGGNKTKAAAILDITLKTLIKKIKDYEINDYLT